MTSPKLPITQDAAFGIVPIYCPAGCALDDAEYLLIQHNAGHWAFPKGHAEGDETPLASAKREFTEETGITKFQILDGASFQEQYIFKTAKKEVHKIVTYYPAFLSKETVTLQEEEIADYRWATYSAARELITYDANLETIAAVHDYLQHYPELLPQT